MDPQLGVEVGQRLIHQEDVGMTHHGAAQCNALPLSAGELRGTTAEQRADLQLVGDGLHFCFDPLHHAPPSRRQQAEQRQPLDQAQPTHDQRHRDVRADGHVGIERITLENHGDLALMRAQLVDRDAADRHAAGILPFQPGDDANQRRLATARGPDQADELAVGDVEIDAGEYALYAEGFDDPLKGQAGHQSAARPDREMVG
jgi:hypothetical protein